MLGGGSIMLYGCFSQNWCFYHSEGKHDWLQILVYFSVKYLGICHQKKGISPFSMTMTQSRHPDQQRNGLTQRRSVFYNGQARAQTCICAQKMNSKCDREWMRNVFNSRCAMLIGLKKSCVTKSKCTSTSLYTCAHLCN